MIENTRISICTLFVAFAVLVLEAAQPYERYQTIVERKPFGPEPVNFNPEAAPGSAANAMGDAGEMTQAQRTVEEQQLASSVRVSMINVTPSGAIAVGFTDSSVSPAENYYLIVGRSQNGWTLKSADPSTESVTLEKGGIDVTVKLGETSGGKGKGTRLSQANRPMTLQSRGETPAASSPETALQAASKVPFGAPMGGLARLRMRRAEMRAKAQIEAEKKAQAAAVAAAEREEREAREAEEKRARAEREARDAEEREQQREALRQIQEQLRKDREARAAAQDGGQNQEGQSETDNVE
jgi:flagellar biosynthesis GTPase FlhF